MNASVLKCFFEMWLVAHTCVCVLASHPSVVLWCVTVNKVSRATPTVRKGDTVRMSSTDDGSFIPYSVVRLSNASTTLQCVCIFCFLKD